MFVTGQVAVAPGHDGLRNRDAIGEMGTIETQTTRVLENIKAILEAAGSSMSRVLKTTVFLRDMADFPKMNAVYGEFFPSEPPARSTVQVAALPRGAAVEIEAVAALA